MLDKALMITVILPTLCYFLAACLSLAKSQPWFALMWCGYAVANFAIMKNQGIL
jgi:hypothetical protein